MSQRATPSQGYPGHVLDRECTSARPQPPHPQSTLHTHRSPAVLGQAARPVPGQVCLLVSPTG